jgi:hypothetical protein
MRVHQKLTRAQVIGYGGKPPRYSDSWIYESKQTADDHRKAVLALSNSLERRRMEAAKAAAQAIVDSFLAAVNAPKRFDEDFE